MVCLTNFSTTKGTLALSLPHAILGLLTYKPMSGYDVKTFFEKSIEHFWPAQLSQIYRELGTLEKRGCVNSHVEPQEGRPDKKVYNITEEGREELLHWLHESPKSLLAYARDETCLRMFFGSRVEPGEMIFQLKLLIREKQKTLQILGDIYESVKHAGYPTEELYWQLTIRKGLLIAAAEVQWAHECIAELEDIRRPRHE